MNSPRLFRRTIHGIDMVFKTAAIFFRHRLSAYPWLINQIDQRPHWARVLEALQYQQFIDRETTFDNIDKSNAHPLGLTIEQYQGGIEFLNGHGLIDFPPEEGETFEGLTIDGFEWIRDRQRTKAQSQQNRATSKLTLALLIVSSVTLFDLQSLYFWGITLVLGYIALTVVYDIVIREY